MSIAGPEDEHPLAAFHAAISARKEALVDRFTERALETLGEHVKASQREEFRARRAGEIDAYIEALVDPSASAVITRATQWVETSQERGLSPAVVQKINMMRRELLLDMGLELHAAGVPRATDGIRRLLKVAQEPTRILDKAFRTHAEATRQTASVFEELLGHMPDGVGVATLKGLLIYANAAFHAMLGEGEGTLIGRQIHDLVAPDARARMRQEVEPSVLERGAWTGLLGYVRADGSTFEARVTAFSVGDAAGRKVARCAIIHDLTEARRAEEERRRLAEEVIAAQKRALDERGTPLVPIAEGVLAMPLVGRIDAARAERMLGVLLEGIAQQGARVVLLDITGVHTADAEAASALVRAARAARLLGTEVVLTGIGPELAQTFVELEADFVSLATKATLRDGVGYAFGKSRRG